MWRGKINHAPFKRILARRLYVFDKVLRSTIFWCKGYCFKVIHCNYASHSSRTSSSLITVVVDGDISSMLKFNSESFYILFWSFQFHFSPAVIRSWWYFFLKFRSYSHKMSNKIVKIRFKLKYYFLQKKRA
jgi:hypothetical protein